MNKHNYAGIFGKDHGELLDIMIFESNLREWQRVLWFLSENYVLVYTQDGVDRSLPRIEDILRAQDEHSVMLEVMLPGFTVNCHPLLPDRIEMDVSPEDVDSPEKAEAVFGLMTQLAGLLDKDVFLTPEFGSATPDELRQLAICVARRDSIHFR